MNAKAVIPLVAGLGIGGIALKVGFDTLKKAQGSQGAVAKVQLWAPKQDIPRGTKITEDMITPLPFPTQLAPKNAVKDKTAVVERVPRLDVPAGLPILDGMLLPPGASAGVNPKPGFRAVAVKIDEGSGVDYHLEPGSWVDVVGSFTVRRDNRPQELVAKTIIENVEVAAVGQRIAPANPKEGESSKDANRMVRAVTLYVKPEQVPTLLLAEQKGRIKLSLRGNQDQSTAQVTAGASESALVPDPEENKAAATDALLERVKAMFAQQQAAKPPVEAAAAPPAAPPVVPDWVMWIYRGAQGEQIRFKDRDSSERVEASPDRGGSLFKPHGIAPPAATKTQIPAPTTAPVKAAQPTPAAEPAAPQAPAAAAAQADKSQEDQETEAEPEEPTE